MENFAPERTETSRDCRPCPAFVLKLFEALESGVHLDVDFRADGARMYSRQASV